MKKDCHIITFMWILQKVFMAAGSSNHMTDRRFLLVLIFFHCTAKKALRKKEKTGVESHGRG